jgi:hypothetical protein
MTADVELGGHLLPAGSRILFSPYALAWAESILLLGAADGRTGRAAIRGPR